MVLSATLLAAAALLVFVREPQARDPRHLNRVAEPHHAMRFLGRYVGWDVLSITENPASRVSL
jgi:hypothetical protein